MPEPLDETPVGQGSQDGASTEIARSLGTVWQRFSGTRPASTSVEVGQNQVSCVIEEGPAETESAEGEDTQGDPGYAPDSWGFQHDATAAVARATGRRVVAFIPKLDAKNRTSKHTFILDQPRRRF